MRTTIAILALVVLAGCSSANPALFSNPCQDAFGAAPNPCEPVYVKPDCNGGPKMGAAPEEPCIPTPVYAAPGCDPLGVGATINGWHKDIFGCEPKGR